MEQKFLKVITKGLVIWPFTTAFSFLITDSGIDINLIIGFVIACSYIFSNIYEYNKQDEIHIKDYLESTHKLEFDNKTDSWTNLYHTLKHQIDPNTRIIKKTESVIQLTIKRRLVNTTLTAEKGENSIELSIKNHHIFAFLPDHAKNYQSLKKLRIAVEG